MKEERFKGRRNVRISKDLKVRFCRIDETGGTMTQAMVLDVSRTGLFIHTVACFPLGMELKVELFLEDEPDPLLMTVVVCRTIEDSASELSGIGVKINTIGAGTKERYEDFVNLLNHYGWFC